MHTHSRTLFSCTDIWRRSDQFHYDHYAASGDVTIEMLVDSFDVGHIWGKGGLMIRESLAPNSKHFSVVMTRDGNRMTNMWRPCTNCNSAHNDNPRIYDRSIYMKITKTGNTFEAFTRKLDSDEWTMIGATQEIQFTTDTFYVGIAVCSLDNTKLAELKGRDFKITAGGN